MMLKQKYFLITKKIESASKNKNILEKKSSNNMYKSS